MSNVSKQIYRELEELLPDLQKLAPFDRIHLADMGLPDINAVVFETLPDRINFVLSRHIPVNGRKIANPYFEITVNPEMRLANVITYKDDHYFHTAEPQSGIGILAQAHANGLLYLWLSTLKKKSQGLKR